MRTRNFVPHSCLHSSNASTPATCAAALTPTKLHAKETITMAITHHFVDASDFSEGGRWAAHYGETVWTKDVRRGGKSHYRAMWPTGEDLRFESVRRRESRSTKLTEKLPRLALEGRRRLRALGLTCKGHTIALRARRSPTLCAFPTATARLV